MVFLVEHFGDGFERVSKELHEAFGREAHCDYSRGYVGEVEIVAVLLVTLFASRDYGPQEIHLEIGKV